MTPQTAQDFAQYGVQQLKAGNPISARSNLETAIQKGYAHPDVWVALGQSCIGTNDTSNAMKAYETALAHAPNHMRALLAKGGLLEQQGELQKATQFYKAALAVAPPPDKIPQDIRPAFMAAFELIKSQTTKYENSLMANLPSPEKIKETSTRFSESVDILLGRAKPYQQKPTRYYFPDLPQKPVFSREEFDWVPALESKTEIIKAELETVLLDQQNLAPYIQAQDSDIVLRNEKLINNSDWSACYLWKNGELQNDMANKCPQTVAALQSLPMDFLKNQAPSVLFSVLKPGAHIPPHNGMLNTRLICHLPLIIPPSCGIRIGNAVLEWKEGEMLIFDDSIEHEAWNKSQQTRVILLFEIWRPEITKEERELIGKMFEAIAQNEE